MGACCSCCGSDEKKNLAADERPVDENVKPSATSSLDASTVSIRDQIVPEVYVAMYKFEAGSTSEVALEKGDRVELLKRESSNFAFVRQLKVHGVRGYVPMEFLAPEGGGAEEEFYSAELQRSDAITLLLDEKNPEGAFVVRGSDAKPPSSGTYDESRDSDAASGFSPFVISAKDGSKPPRVHHYRIKVAPSARLYFLRPQKKFPTMRELITFYQNNPPGTDLCCKLTKCIVPSRTSPPVRRELPQDMKDRWREIPRDQLIMQRNLGEGRFGEVQKALWNQLGGEQTTVVAKNLKSLNLADRQALLNEAAMLKDLVHENIVRLYGVVSASEPYYIITEFVKNGSLQDYLKERRKLRQPSLDTASLVEICVQMAHGMAYLGSKRIVHRDLAARNVLIDVKTESPFSFVIKICDFGLARTLSKDYVYRMKTETYIAIRWLAPEGFDTEFSSKTDVWAFGITMAEIFSGGGDPWGDLSDGEVKRRILSGRAPDKPAEMPIPIYAVVKHCCQREQEARPAFKELVIELENVLKSTKAKTPGMMIQ